MTTEPVSAGGDPRRLLSEVRSLAHRVRVDQRMTWVALLVLAGVTFVGIPFDWLGMTVRCRPDSSCEFARRGALYYWPPALLLAYAAIAVSYVRAARARGLGARVLPYVIAGAATTVVFTAAWVAAPLYFASHPESMQRLSYWWLVLDRLVSPWSMIGIALVVLARIERNIGLLLFTLAYLALVLLVLPMNEGWGLAGWGLQAQFAVPQAISGAVLLLGAVGFFTAARRRQR
ncbi:hypothetical protein [Micromonospora endolithica]|uniref:DUF998 domain-containing protein n=1 Tax=Micromonospora endolithica TaxID=230091 RepID=A0A3A9ZK99_9ACTN|nr:hypothetical protein [Micromonospora endolithica]RKN48639.1 hypothetical protein D7223_11735 [Micromonospora endolithica]TWJ22026.1 hypothetical protein JD76_02140 [Micromonospora endolithica]